ncbi:MAG: hypothetical protein QNJ42_01165 [Crocosphaera sp.]|nr:hypothetical protein [Crocosphaera sp.]
MLDCFTKIKKILKIELDHPEKSRLRDLIKNPLRLALLCASWQIQEAQLPDTQAEFYEMYVDYFYKWKSEHFEVSKVPFVKLSMGGVGSVGSVGGIFI